MTSHLPMPLDIRLMNATTATLALVLAVMAVALAMTWGMRLPMFAIAGITVQGEVTHSNEVTVRANVASHLSGSFFDLDLEQARNVFEGLPWVRRAVVRREFPNRLRVQLQEHHAVAYWGPEDESRLVNSFGEVFEANVGEVEKENLPRLMGPTDQAATVLSTYRALMPIFEELDFGLDQLELSPRGAWRAQLDNGASIELGSGSTQELIERSKRFVRTLTQVASRHGRRTDALESADLRYPHGYALQLQGVTTVAPGSEPLRQGR